MRRIKNYKNMSREELLISLLKSEQSVAELRISKSNSAEIEGIKKNFNVLRNNFSKEKIKEIRKKIYEREKIDKYFKELEKKKFKKRSKKIPRKTRKKYQEEREKKHYAKELKKVDEFLKKLEEEDFNTLKKHHYRDNDDPDYKGIRQIENLFDKISEVYYKPVKIKSAFNDNYIEYESRRDKGKKLSLKEYLFMIMSYLRDMINNPKAPIKIEDDFFGESKIQWTMQINFISSLDPGEIRKMDSKSDNVEITMGNVTNDIIKELFKSFFESIRKNWKKKWKIASFFWKCWFIVL